MPRLTHVGSDGNASMVDVSEKPETAREAAARAEVAMKPETLRMISEGNAPKGDVFSVARLAGIMAAKRTHDLIPLCHSLNLDKVGVEISADADQSRVVIDAVARTRGSTGVEMEALTAASVRGAHDLRHVQGSGPRYADHRHPPAPQVGRTLGRVPGLPSGMLPVREAIERNRSAGRAGRRRASPPGGGGRADASRGSRRADLPSAGARLGNGWLCGPHRRCPRRRGTGL